MDSRELRVAKKLNTAGYKARKRGDHAEALSKYQEAVATAPNYETARFNLACELALARRADEAVAQLEYLLRLGTQKALLRVAKVQIDTDFDPIRNDPRIRAFAARFDHDLDAPVFKQLCANRGKMLGFIGPGGFFKLGHTMKQGSPRVTSKKVEGGKARSTLDKILDQVCQNGRVRVGADGAVLSDTVLSKWTSRHKKRCVHVDGVRHPNYYAPSPYPCPKADIDLNIEGMDGSICFIRQGQRWIVGVAGLFSDVPFGEEGGSVEHLKPQIDRVAYKAAGAWGR